MVLVAVRVPTSRGRLARLLKSARIGTGAKIEKRFAFSARQWVMAVQGTDQERSAVTGTIGNEEGAPALSFADVARQITGDGAPDWLVEAMKNWGPCLMIHRGVAYKQPTRSEMRKNLQRSNARCKRVE
jgi:hypothetical protein